MTLSEVKGFERQKGHTQIYRDAESMVEASKVDEAGLFADGTYGKRFNGVSGTVTCIIFIFGVMSVFFKLLAEIVPLRVSLETELQGLDQSEVGVTAYSVFHLYKTHR